MLPILERAIARKAIGERTIEQSLADICQSAHANCDPGECPVAARLDDLGYAVMSCDCYGNGKAMLRFLRKNPPRVRPRSPQ